MNHLQPFIDVWNCRATVARYIREGNALTWEPAINASQLEDEAAEIVNEQGGAINMSGHYICPPELAAKAIWE